MLQPVCQHCVAGVQLLSGVETYLSALCCRGFSCLSGVKTYLLTLCCRGAAVEAVSNLSAGTVLQGCSCLSGVETYLPALCCRVTAVLAVSKPICRHCVAGMQLLKHCPNLPAGTVLQGCSCLSGVETYLLALCCRGAAVLAVSKPICRHCVAG